jgi:hypothetical protein
MKAGKLVHRTVSAEQAELLLRAIGNYRRVKKVLRAWETETERLIDAAALHRRSAKKGDKLSKVATSPAKVRGAAD